MPIPHHATVTFVFPTFFLLCHASGQICADAAERRLRGTFAFGKRMVRTCFASCLKTFLPFLLFFSLLLDLFWFFVLLLLRAECACVLFPQPTNAYLIATIFDGQWNSRNE